MIQQVQSCLSFSFQCLLSFRIILCPYSFENYKLSEMDGTRDLVLKLHQKGYKNIEIVRKLKSLKICRKFVERTLKRYRDTGTVKISKQRNRKPSVRSPALIKWLRERVRRDPAKSTRKLAADLNISHQSVHRILKRDLKFKAYKKQKAHGLTEKQRVERKRRSKFLLQWHADSDIIFSDEKLFLLQESHNPQNDRLYAASKATLPVNRKTIQRFQNRSSVMVWGAISRRGRLPLLFLEKGVKIKKENYLQNVLKDHLLPEAQKIFGDEYFLFQQDSAPAHKAKLVQAWCEENLPDYIPASEWPASSPDANPLDFCIWGYMLARLTNVRVTSLTTFKILLTKIWEEIPDEVVRAACDSFPKKLRQIVKANGNRIE